jgi:hypothetical protein
MPVPSQSPFVNYIRSSRNISHSYRISSAVNVHPITFRGITKSHIISLDKGYFVKKNKKILPDWFTQAMHTRQQIKAYLVLRVKLTGAVNR